MTPGPVEIPGPWQHRHVAANGARFHVVAADPDGGAGEAGSAAASGTGRRGPLVLLLHGFPEFWWAWRHQLPALASRGFRAVAMDLRGYGGSDKTPRGYDPITLADDVAGVVKALGAPSATLVGHGWGGYVAWATAAIHPLQVSAVAALASPHPRQLLADLSHSRPTAVRHVLAMQVPRRPERRLADPRSGFLQRHLEAWSAPDSPFPDAEAVARYQDAFTLWPAPHCALEYHRWLVRSRLRADGRRFARLMAAPVDRPAYLLLGGDDPALPPPGRDRSERFVTGPFRREVVEGSGHFPMEEHPELVTDRLLAWLGGS